VEHTAAKVGDNAPVGTDATEAGKLTAHESMLKEIHSRVEAVERHLGIKKEPGVAKEEGKKRRRH
jgi:hypothetical protein